MTVIVNTSSIRIFSGATGNPKEDSNRRRNKLDISKVSSLQVTDQWGHKIGFEAPLSENQMIKVINP